MGMKQPDGWVRIVPRFYVDLKVLLELTAYDMPPYVPLRAAHNTAVYCIGDASGHGFGIIFWIQGGERIQAEHRTWIWDVSENIISSNFCEGANLVIRLKQLFLE